MVFEIRYDVPGGRPIVPERTGMTLKEYQEGARKTAIYPGRGTFIGALYASTGLNGEAGEVAEKTKKIMREETSFFAEHLLFALKDMYDKGQLENLYRPMEVDLDAINYILQTLPIVPKGCPEERKQGIKKELGDVLWFLAAMADEFGFTLEEIAMDNLSKLKARQEQGLLHGNGDNREIL